MRVAVADDSALLRIGVAALLRAAGFDVIAEVDTADALLDAVEAHRPELVVTDIKMPPTFQREGLEAANTIKRHFPEVGVLVLSQYDEVNYARHLLSTSGVGYLLKDRVSRRDDFIGAAIRVASGEVVIDPDLVHTLLNKKRAQDPLAVLTDRERAILRLMAEGRSNAGIGEKLYLSTKTVEAHITSIFTKLQLPASPSLQRRVLAVLDYLKA